MTCRICERIVCGHGGVVDMEERVPGRDQVGCGREEINDGEKQVREKDKRQPTNAQTHIMDDMRME